MSKLRYRLLDLADETGQLCGKLLAGLGIEVVKVEPPGGDYARHRGPFYNGIDDPEKSLYWFAYNQGKKSITLDIEPAEGQDIFKKLAEEADFVVETFPPGYMDDMRLGYRSLSQVNPGIIMASLTHFGQSGPYRDYKGSDLVCLALSGALFTQGYPERRPTRCSIPLSYMQANSEAAAALMLAHFYRLKTGEGQHIDLSYHDVAATFMGPGAAYWFFNQVVIGRAGASLRRVNKGVAVDMPIVYPTKDGGHICGFLSGEWLEKIVSWMDSEGMAGDLTDEKWKDRHVMSADPPFTQEEAAHEAEVLREFTLSHDALDIQREAQIRDIGWAKMYSPKDIAEDEQLAARGFWNEVEHSELGEIFRYPGAPFLSTEPLWKVLERAPLLGEHNQEIYEEELGLSRDEIVALRSRGII